MFSDEARVLPDLPLRLCVRFSGGSYCRCEPAGKGVHDLVEDVHAVDGRRCECCVEDINGLRTIVSLRRKG